MNKKEPLQISVGTIVTIILLMTFLILGLVVVRTIFTEPEFKITKEVCQEEINLDFQDCWLEVLDRYPCLESSDWDKSFCFPEYQKEARVCSNKYSQLKTTCEEKEVDEIEYGRKLDSFTCPINKKALDITRTAPDGFEIQRFENVTGEEIEVEVFSNGTTIVNSETCTIKYKPEKISKQDLTEEWLNTNTDECLIDKEYWVSTDEFGTIAKGECSKWKINNYTIYRNG